MSPFPPALPVDDDPGSIYDNDWAAFRALETMDTHWKRPGWTPGRRSYHWMLTFETAPDLRHHVGECQNVVPVEGFDLVDPGSVHLTLGRIGFADELSLGTAQDVVSTAGKHVSGVAGFGLRVGPVSGSRGAIRFSVAPWSSLSLLHEGLTTATRDVLGDRCTMDTGSFRPHISIAYAHRRMSTEAMVPLLEPLRFRTGPLLAVDHVSMVRLERVDRSYAFRPLARIGLAGRDVEID